MKILAIDTSSKNYSLAILDHQQPVVEVQVAQGMRAGVEGHFDHVIGKKRMLQKMPGVASSLFRLFEDLLQQGDFQLRECELLAVASGPGGFTGLRAGVVAAKLLAYSLSIPIVAINTLEVIARQTVIQSPAVTADRLQIVLNAQRQQLFVGQYQVIEKGQQAAPLPSGSNFSLLETNEMQLMTRDRWISQLSADEWISGAGLVEVLAAKDDLPGIIAPRSSWFTSASSVGQLALEKYQNGLTSDIWALEPLYFRPSYAEEI